MTTFSNKHQKVNFLINRINLMNTSKKEIKKQINKYLKDV